MQSSICARYLHSRNECINHYAFITIKQTEINIDKLIHQKHQLSQELWARNLLQITHLKGADFPWNHVVDVFGQTTLPSFIHMNVHIYISMYSDGFKPA